MDTVFGRIRLKRGLESGLPTLAIGEPYFAEDTEAIWVGTAAGNVEVIGGAGVAAALAAHLADTSAAHAASAIAFTPAGGVAATEVQAAIAELDTEKASTGSVSSLTALAVAIATDLTAHIADTSAAHAASAIAFTPAGGVAATEVQAAIAELDTEKASTGSVSTVAAAAAAVAADLATHVADATDAHAASAISFAGGITYAANNVQTAIVEVDMTLQDMVNDLAMDVGDELAALDLAKESKIVARKLAFLDL